MLVRFFIGTSAGGEDALAELAYEHTLREQCSDDLDITWMRQSTDSKSIWGCWDDSHWPTPFSGFRWAVAEACEFSGRAIYTDVDMLCFRDPVELLNVDLQGKPVGARRGTRFGGHEFCVMVIDCEKMREHVLPVRRQKVLPNAHARMVHKFSGNGKLVQDIDPRWNCLDGDSDDPWILHFTTMATQPWKPAWYRGTPREHPRQDLADLWNSKVLAAQESGASSQVPDIDYEKFTDYHGYCK